MGKCNFKRIWHIGAWNRNLGDCTAGYNLHRMLENQAAERGMALSFYLVDSQRSLFHDALIKQMNEEADLLLIGAGGMIFNRPQDESQSGWAFNISIGDLKKIETPMVVYGIGFNKFQYDPNKWPDSMGQHLGTLQKRAKIFSVRNEGSRARLLDEFGLSVEDTEIIPDPGMRLFDRHIDIPGLNGNRPLIGINWAGDRPEERFPEPWEENRTFFVSELRKSLIKMVEEKNAQVIFIPHLQDVDVSFWDELNVGFPEGSIINSYEVLKHLYPPAGELLYNHIPFMTNLYRQCDLMLGMRGHSCIFSFGAGTRFMPLGSHNKVMYFAEDVGVPLYPIRMMNPKEHNSDYMYNNINDCLADKDWDTNYEKLQKVQFDKLDVANERVLDLIR